MRVESSAPCRADLAGGTLDIWPLGLLHLGALTVNVALPVVVRLLLDERAPAGEVLHSVGGGPWSRLGEEDATSDLTAAVAFALRPAGSLRVRVEEQAPMGSGLGGSSAYAVALIRGVAALEGEDLDDVAVVRLARDLEARVLQAPTGTQDHWAAVRGGCLALHLEAGGDRLEALAVDPVWLAAHLTVFFTGIVHHSGMVNWQVVRRRIEGEASTTAGLEEISRAASRCRRALLDGDRAGVAEAVNREWEARRRLAPEVCPPELVEVEAAARDAGALAFKACGAGGGGSVLLWHREVDRPVLVEAMRSAAPDGIAFPPGISETGCLVTPATV